MFKFFIDIIDNIYEVGIKNKPPIINLVHITVLTCAAPLKAAANINCTISNKTSILIIGIILAVFIVNDPSWSKRDIKILGHMAKKISILDTIKKDIISTFLI